MVGLSHRSAGSIDGSERSRVGGYFVGAAKLAAAEAANAASEGE